MYSAVQAFAPWDKAVVLYRLSSYQQVRRLQPDTDRKNRNEAGGTKFGNALCGAGQACKEQLIFYTSGL